MGGSPPPTAGSRFKGKPKSLSSPIKAICCCCPSPLGFDFPGMDEPGEEEEGLGLVVDDDEPAV